MSKSNLFFVLLTTALFAFLGGVLSPLIFPCTHTETDAVNTITDTDTDAETETSKIITAESIETGLIKIVGEDGNVQVLISARPVGCPILEMYGKDRESRIAMAINGKQNPVLLFYDSKDLPRLQLFLSNGFPNVWLVDEFKDIETALPIKPQHIKEWKMWPD